MNDLIEELAESLAPGMVRIVHKEAGLTSIVQESTVPGWETAGWTRADNGGEEQGQQALDLSTSSNQPPAVKPGDKNEENTP